VTNHHLYLYGVVRAGAAPPAGVPVVEPSAGDLRGFEHGRLMTLASPLEGSRVRTTAANLDAHQRVVEGAMRRGVVLPFRFGMLVESEESLLDDFLAGNEERLVRMLDRFEHLVEVRVTARYCGDQALREVVRSSGRIRRLQSKVELRSDAASYYDRIALGEEVIRGLGRLRERDAEGVSSRLRTAAKSERRLPSDSDQTVLRAAYLLDASRLQQFDRALAAVGERQSGRMELSFVGPLAPWDFVELNGDDLRPLPRLRPRTLSRLRAAA
jgi:hypothetical protein